MLRGKFASLFSDCPVLRPADWSELVEARWKEQDLSTERTSVSRGRPFGQDASNGGVTNAGRVLSQSGCFI